MKIIRVFLALLGLTLFSCSDNNEGSDPAAPKELTYKIRIVHGNGQKSDFNKTLQDSLVISVHDKSNRPVKGAWVRFTVNTNNGVANREYVKTDATGNAFSKWTLGCVSGRQVLKTYVVDSLSRKVDSVEFISTATAPTAWGKACGTDGEFTHLARHPAGKLFAISGRSKLVVSSDRGVSWTEVSIFPFSYSFVEKLAIRMNGDIFLATNNAGLLVSRDLGATWISKNNGIGDTRYPYDLVSLADGRLFFSSYFGGLFRSVDGGENWVRTQSGLRDNDRFSQLSKHPDGTLYVITDVGGLYKSMDGGDNWTYFRPNVAYSVSSIHVSDDGAIWIGGSNYYAEVFRSIDNGETWYTVGGIYDHSSCFTQITRILKYEDDLYFYTGCKGLYRQRNGITELLGPENDMYWYPNADFLLLSKKEMIRGSSNGIFYNFNLY